MSKKNKDIEVRVEEEKAQYNGANVLMNKLFIGKKEIGRVIPQNDKKFIIESSYPSFQNISGREMFFFCIII
ncbi:DUF2969 family protein [Enterococcus faecalis]